AIKFDDLQDQYNDIWGINVTDGSLQGQNPRKKTSNSNNFVMCAVSIEPLKARGVPGPLCDLIANMLDAADADGNARLGREDAYRDVSDVRDDLQLMLEKPSIYLYDQDMRRLSTTGLQFGGTLFGRKAELSTIIDSYRRSAAGGSESVVISGKSGTGKSLLAVEVGNYVISNGGILLTGKFDQLQQGKPFSALASAFNQFCDFLESNHALVSEKQKLARQLDCVLGNDAYYLTKLIPKLATILGMSICCSYHDENCVNAQKRLQWLLCGFVQVISTSFAAPVTLFLDDLQWADPASIAAVNDLSLAVNPTSQDAHFFFLGCYPNLSTLSCFGASVSSSFVKTLERALGRTLLDSMDAAVAEGLLDKIDDHYRFSHDRIQEAAYNMMDVLDRCNYHFSYGMALAPLVDEEDGFIFTAVMQLNKAGPEAVEEKRQHAIVADLNLRAGKKAMEMSDFEAAYSYFDNGITFLRKKHWEEHYALSLELFNLAANCALSNGDFISLKLLSQQVMRQAQSFEDKLNVMYCITNSLAYSSKIPEAIEKSLDILSRLGIELRGRESSVEVCVKETKDMLSAYTYDELLNMRRMTDSTMIMAMNKLMLAMGQIMPKSAPHVAQQIIQLSLSHGMSPASPLGFAHFGSYAANLGDIRGGYNYVKLARSLMDKSGSRENAGEIICLHTQVVSYLEPLQATLEYHDEGYAAAMAAGDIIQASVNIYTGFISTFHAGVKLQKIREKGDEVIKFMQERKVVVFLIPVQCMQNSVLKLIGIDEEPKDNDAENESILAKNINAKAAHYLQNLRKEILGPIWCSHTLSVNFALVSFHSGWPEAQMIGSNGSFREFCIGLVSFWVARSSNDREQWYERGKKSKLALRKWAETSQWTFENKWFLLEAEEAFCNSNFDEAKLYYEKAVTSAQNHKFVHEEALACELAAYFYLEIGDAINAAEYCLRAHERYQEWGAIGKCTSLFEYFGSVMNGCVASSQANAT
ncbi:hypothetical protein ACHAWT_001521, partial [Skeletonema menzelii]